MTIIFDTVTKPIVGAEWANAKVVVAPVAPFFAADGREVAGTKFEITDLVGYAEFDLEPTVGATPSGCWYVWTNPDGSQRAFTVPATGGPYSLQQCLISAPQNPGVINGGLTLAGLESNLGVTLPPTGTPSSSTFLRGDGAWGTPAGTGMTATDNGDGTITLAGSSGYTDNGDGTISLS